MMPCLPLRPMRTALPERSSALRVIMGPRVEPGDDEVGEVSGFEDGGNLAGDRLRFRPPISVRKRSAPAARASVAFASGRKAAPVSVSSIRRPVRWNSAMP